MTFRAAAAAVLVLLTASSFAGPAVVRLFEAPARLPDGERAHPWRSSWLRASA